MSIDGICVQVRGNVQLGVSLAKLNLADFDEGEAHFYISRVRNAVAQQKRLAPLQILLGGTLPLAFAR